MPPGGIRTRNSRVIADSQPVSGLGPASKPQRVSGSRSACSHIGKNIYVSVLHLESHNY